MEMKVEYVSCRSDQKKEMEEEKGSIIHVLAVDDSVIDRKLLERLLTVSSYQVTCVDSVNKALEYLGLVDSKDENDSTTPSSSSSCSCPSSSESSQQEVPGSKVNLIMTDYSMPGMSGYDLLKRVKGSSRKDVPVVVMSSENVPSRINMCLEGGAEEFLLKPVKLSDLRKLPTLLNSLSQTSITINDGELDGFVNEDKDESNNIDKSCIINNVYKRKAVSPKQSERRPKLKELAVVSKELTSIQGF